VAETVEKQERRNVAADSSRLEAGQRLEKTIDFAKMRDAGRIQPEGLDAGEEVIVGIDVPARAQACKQPFPGLLIGFGIEFVGLFDKDMAFLALVLDEGGVSGR